MEASVIYDNEFDGLDELISQVKNLKDSFAELSNTISDSLSKISKSTEKTNKIIEKLSRTIKQISVDNLKDLEKIKFGDIIENISSTSSVITTLVSGLKGLGSLAGPISAVITAVIALIGGIILVSQNMSKSEKSMDKYEKSISSTMKSVKTFTQNLSEIEPQLIPVDKLLSTSGNSMSDIETGINTSQQKIYNIIKDAKTKRGKLLESEIDEIINHQDKINKLMNQSMQISLGNQKSEKILLEYEVNSGNFSYDTILQHLVNADANYNKSIDNAKELFGNEFAQLESMKNLGLGYGEYSSYEEGLESIYDNLEKNTQDAKKEYDEFVSYANLLTKNNLVDNNVDDLGVLASIRDEYVKINEEAVRKYPILDSDDPVGTMVNREKYAMEEISRLGDAYNETLLKLSPELISALNGTIGMGVSMVSQDQPISDDLKGYLEYIFVGLEDSPFSSKEDTKTLLEGLTVGLNEYIPELDNIEKLSSNDIIVALREYLGMDEKELREEYKINGSDIVDIMGPFPMELPEGVSVIPIDLSEVNTQAGYTNGIKDNPNTSDTSSIWDGIGDWFSGIGDTVKGWFTKSSEEDSLGYSYSEIGAPQTLSATAAPANEPITIAPVYNIEIASTVDEEAIADLIVTTANEVWDNEVANLSSKRFRTFAPVPMVIK